MLFQRLYIAKSQHTNILDVSQVSEPSRVIEIKANGLRPGVSSAGMPGATATADTDCQRQEQLNQSMAVIRPTC